MVTGWKHSPHPPFILDKTRLIEEYCFWHCWLLCCWLSCCWLSCCWLFYCLLLYCWFVQYPDSLWLLELHSQHCWMAWAGGQGEAGLRCNHHWNEMVQFLVMKSVSVYASFKEEDFMYLWSDFLSKSTESLENAASGVGQQMPGWLIKINENYGRMWQVWPLANFDTKAQ